MAVCEIWDVRVRLDNPIGYAENPEKTANPKYTESDLQALGDVMQYATNGGKTEKQFFVIGVNCVVLVYKCGHEKWNNLSYPMKE